MCYYTITTDQLSKQGHMQAIMIIDAESDKIAVQEYIKTFNLSDYKLQKGIEFKGFENLLTEDIKKYILKHLSGKKSPLVSYCNSLYTKHAE